MDGDGVVSSDDLFGALLLTIGGVRDDVSRHQRNSGDIRLCGLLSQQLGSPCLLHLVPTLPHFSSNQIYELVLLAAVGYG